jgi:hypothetical protein
MDHKLITYVHNLVTTYKYTLYTKASTSIYVEDAPRTLRRRSRNAGKADGHTLLKAERLTNKKNLEGISFSSFLDSHIISNLGRLAINTNTSGVVRIKNLEVDRLVVCANKILKLTLMI